MEICVQKNWKSHPYKQSYPAEEPAALTGITGIIQHHLTVGFITGLAAMCQNHHHPKGVGRWGETLNSQ